MFVGFRVNLAYQKWFRGHDAKCINSIKLKKISKFVTKFSSSSSYQNSLSTSREAQISVLMKLKETRVKVLHCPYFVVSKQGQMKASSF